VDDVSDATSGDRQPVTTAAQLAQMTPSQRQAHFDASVVTDLSRVQPEFLARVRARLDRRIAAQDPSTRA
jgi:hypothetical protein